MKLYQHQQELVDKNPHKYGIFWRPGTGKTQGALALAQKNNIDVLIIVPKPVIQKWKDACEEMGVSGRVIGREQFRIHAQNIDRYNGVIVDESHAVFGNHKSKGFKQLNRYLKNHKIEYLWLLTGTVYTSSPWSCYAAAQLLGHNWSYPHFREKFFQPRYLGTRVIWEPKSGIEDELSQAISKIGSIVTLEDCFDVPEQTFEVERFEQTKEQKKAVKEMEQEEFDPIVQITKKHQIASGVLKGNEFEEDKEIKALKNDQIIADCEENDKIIVFSRYNGHLNFLKKELDKKKIPCRVINGTVNDKEPIFQEAERSDRMILLVNSMISVGYEVPSFSYMIFASLSFSYVDFSQAVNRILRANALKKNYYKIMITKGTVDEAVNKSVKKKEDFSATIYSKKSV